jgi:excisionase family DNA binding protein
VSPPRPSFDGQIPSTLSDQGEEASRPPGLTRQRLLDADDIADWLAIPKGAVYRLVRESRLPSIAVGRYLRFDTTALQAWIDAGGRGLEKD